MPQRMTSLVRFPLWPLSFSLLVALGGCGTAAPAPKGPPAITQASAGSSDEILASALTMLDQLERYNEQKIALPTKSADANEPQYLAVVRFANPETLDLVVDRLNLWAEANKRPTEWKRDPLLESLPADLLKKLPAVERLADQRFSRESAGPGFALHDGWALQQTLWLRDAAKGASGRKIEDLERARKLFDWTVRNVQLMDPAARIVPESPATWRELPLDPWHVLLLGRGLAAHRAWIFMLLARQQELNVVLLARDNAEKPGELVEWAAALVQGDEQKPELYLFEPTLGVPIPGPGGKGIATLAQVRGDDALLRHLDADAEHPYPVRSADLAQVTALVETSPTYAARRMKQLEEQMGTTNRMILSVETPHLAKRLANAGVSARAWERPFRNQADFNRMPEPVRDQFKLLLLPLEDVPLLWNGRASHLRGRLTGDRSAFHYYLQVHFPDEVIAKGRDHLGNPYTEPQRRLIRVAKGHASYWMGLASYEQSDQQEKEDEKSKALRAAENHLKTRTLEQQPGGPFTTGARYNLARVLQAQAEGALAKGETKDAENLFAQAAEVLRDPADAASPCRSGNLLLARWLEARAKGK